MQLSLQDVLVNNERIVVSKGVNTSDHLVDQDTQSPPVDWFSVALILKNLGSQILWSSTKSECSILDRFGKTKVCEFEISVDSNEDVLGLEIAINDVFGVEILEDENNVGCIETKWFFKYAAL